MLATVRTIYRQSKKTQDNAWTEWVSRPPAAVVVWALRPTPVTPNQVTFLSLATFAGAVAAMVLWRTHAGLVVAWALMQASYVLDCADGQLARLKQLSSPVGALLDFLMDEIKAFLLVGGAAVRLWWQSRSDEWLLIGIGGLVICASGIALTTFMRRPEYLATGKAPVSQTATPKRSPLFAVEWLGKLVLHYPSWFLVVAIADRLDLFLYLYLGAHLLYLGRASLSVLVRLGRPARATPTEN